ncbi:unnamed protein product [Closterium sp. NIES-53]
MPWQGGKASENNTDKHKTAKALHDAVVARYSSPPTAALGYLILPYLFPELSAFPTVEDLITHLRTSDNRYRATLTAKFLDKNPPPMYITLYFIVTHLPDSLRAVRDHFLALDPTYLTIDLLEKHLLATETSEVTVGAARGTPRTPFFEGLVLLLLGSVATARAREARVVEVAAGVVVVEAVEAVEVAEVAVGVVAGVGASVASVVATVRVVVAVVAAVGVVAAAVVEVRVELFRGEVLEVAGGSSSSVRARPLRPSSFVSGLLSMGRLGVGDDAEHPRWLKLHRSAVDIFAIDYDAILAAMYALSGSAGGECYLCLPLDLGIEATALGASESTFPGTAPADALHTFTLDSEPPQVAPSGKVSASGPLAAPCLCRLLSHQSLLWNHRLGHPSLPRLRSMHSHLLVFGLPMSLPPLPPSPAPPCLPCIEWRQRAAPHPCTLSTWTGGKFSSVLLWEFCRGEGILQSFTLPASPMQNRVAERRIGLFMEVARTSMIHAAPPHFLWPFAVRYTAHQLSLWPRVSLPETSPTLRLTGKVDDASVFRVRGFHAFVSDTSADKLSSYAILCVFLGFPPDEPSWQFYHPTSRRVLSSQDFTFEESVPIYRLFSYRTAPPAPPRPPRVGATLQFAFGLLSFRDPSWLGTVRHCSTSLYLGSWEPLGADSTMAGPEERGGTVAGGSGEAQAQGQPRDSAMAPMQPSLGPPRDEPRVFGLDKFNGDNFAEWSFKM